MRRIVSLTLLVLLAFAAPAWAAVALDSTGTNEVFANDVTTKDLTTLTVGTGANTVLLALISWCTAGTLPTGITVTWDPTGVNQALTQVVTVDSPNSLKRAALFRLIAPAAGNLTLRASWTNTNDIVLGGAEFSGVNQTTPIVVADNRTASDAGATQPTITVTSDANGATVAVETVASGIPAMNQTQLYSDSSPNHCSAGANYALGGASNVHNQAAVGSQWGIVGVHLQAVAATAKLFRQAGDLTGLSVGGPFFKGVE